ncbi:MAG: T9SS type A sorting domain-containing protein [Melioribacteraceae bacterium]|nr:T9SS type A sorting domain-containing protein [Melioribacteraceae bacterium]
MRFNYKLMLLALFTVLMVWPASQSLAQASDTLLVKWQNPDGTVKADALRDAIVNDANRPAGRVYKLEKGGFYWMTETIENDGFHLRIVGENPGKADVENPAVLQMVTRADGSVNGRLITGKSHITLKNLYIVGADNNGVQTYYQPFQIDASDSRFHFDGCVFERSNFAMIAVTGKNNDFVITNCKFRNLIGQPSTQQWEGRAISMWADQDSVIIENNTFFNLGMTALQIEGGAASYVLFNHNTLVNVGRTINTGAWWREAYFANNLLINIFFHGEGFADYDLVRNPSRDPRAKTSGFFSIGTLPSKYGPEEGRRVVFTNAAAYRDPKFKTYYGDTIRAQYFINQVAREDFIDKYSAMVIKDTTWLTAQPAIKTYTSDIIDKMIANINDLRRGITPATPYFWQPPVDPLLPSWPLPEDFSYTDASLLTAGSDGLPLGDLNWFPAKKQDYLASRAANIKKIEDMAGSKVEYTIVETKEAETGVVGAGAAVKAVSGFSYVQMDGGGFFEWEFNLATAGEYELNVWTHMRNNGQRGQRIIVNGVSIHDPMGWGEYIWGGSGNIWESMPKDAWTWTLIKQSQILEAGALTLPAGKNKIRVEASWGWQNFAGFDLKLGGAVVKELRIPDLTSSDLVKIIVEGAKWTPSALKSVAMGTNGTLTLDFDVAKQGTYRIQYGYQNGGSKQNGSIKVNGTTAVASLDFEGKADSTGLTKLSPSFQLPAGKASIQLVASGINVDYATLLLETVVTSVEGEEIPAGYALDQNYPNPFNPTTTIKYSIPKESQVSLKIYDVLGREVMTLMDAKQNAGKYDITFNASKLASGVYIYRIIAGDFVQTKKMMLLK